MSEYMVSIGTYVTQASVQFITGDLSLERDWNSYLQKLDSMDLNGYISLTQKTYDEYQAALKG